MIRPLLTKRARKRLNASHNTVIGKHGLKYVTGCPFGCLGREVKMSAQRVPFQVTAGYHQRSARCPVGHVWRIAKPLMF